MINRRHLGRKELAIGKRQRRSATESRQYGDRDAYNYLILYERIHYMNLKLS